MAAWKTLDHQSLIEFVGQLIKEVGITEQQLSHALPSDRPSTCRFKATRGNGEICGQQSVVPYGFCTKHKSSVQGKQAKELFEKQQEEKAKQAEKVSAPPASVQEKKQTTTISIRKNAFGNWQHSETGIIFRNHDKKASGIQNSKGEITPLTKEAVQYCEKRGWSYVSPEVEEDTDEDEETAEDESAEEEDSEEEEEEDDDEEEEEQEETEEEILEEDD
uniref:Uncharacterized protein n=1 Tax=Marseillevirus sp. TaxID=2809551 RepID=A0AA96ENQ2_9VIRU|nr:hypothetical protein MarFTMF_353 [Marseillevirus sp.]